VQHDEMVAGHVVPLTGGSASPWSAADALGLGKAGRTVTLVGGLMTVPSRCGALLAS
jgi:hypothetical protein